MDYLNPGFSKKDRIARQMIEDAEAQGVVEPGDTMVELTSGNTAAAIQLLSTNHPGATAVVLMCDSSPKHLSTQLYNR